MCFTFRIGSCPLGQCAAGKFPNNTIPNNFDSVIETLVFIALLTKSSAFYAPSYLRWVYKATSFATEIQEFWQLTKFNHPKTWVPKLGYMFPQGYIYLSGGVHLRLATQAKKYVCTLLISNYLYIWICPKSFMLLMVLYKGEYGVHTCLL